MRNLMKNKFVLFLFAIYSFMVLLPSCKKDSDIPAPYCFAGKGGTITIKLQPQHHGDAITGLPGYPDSAFIKFNSGEYPGGEQLGLYDLVVAGTPGSSEVVISNLKCGSYFIFMTGFDVSIAERVKGGIPVTIAPGDEIKNIIIPVTED